MLSAIWYGPSACFYVTLTPSSGEEQALVDTLFPQIYGKRRGVTLHEYAAAPAFYDASLDALYARLADGRVGTRPAALLEAQAAAESKADDRSGVGGAGAGASGARTERVGQLADPSRMMVCVRGGGGAGVRGRPFVAWRVRLPAAPHPQVRVSVWEASDAVPDPEAMRLRDEADAEGDSKEDEGESAPPGPTIDVTGGEGYTQVRRGWGGV